MDTLEAVLHIGDPVLVNGAQKKKSIGTHLFLYPNPSKGPVSQPLTQILGEWLERASSFDLKIIT